MSDGPEPSRARTTGAPPAETRVARPWATWGACALALVLFVASWAPGWWRGEFSGWAMIPGPTLSRWGALDLVEIWDRGAWWRLFTGAWLHGSWVHLTLNLIGLWSVGRWVEGVVGPWRLLVILVMSATIGCLASLVVVEAGLVVGISGGVFGLAGALLSLRLGSANNSVLARISPWELGFWLVLWLVVGAFAPAVLGGGAVIAQGGHVGGLVTGLVAGWAFGLADGRAAARTLCLSGLALAGLGLGWFGASPPDEPEVAALRGYRALDGGDAAEAALRFGEALEGAPDDPELLNARAYARAEAGIELGEARDDVRRALEGLSSDEAELRVNMLDTAAWIECVAGQTASGEAALDAVIRAAEVQGMETEVFEDHRARCADVGP